ncbi:hypothetical protein ES675_00070 [Bizionia algoritergicola]|uniref:Uncharacterized protein n=3 Tax=Bizionia TaxID=283785 RepID=A0A5D0R243_9FLAO|nr:hypothetical protein ES675_00070 [Bizionia algoritergicola]
MMDAVIQNIQDKVSTLPIPYVDEDWGQLDYYSPNFPVKWPCVLIDVTNAQFDNLGQDKGAAPVNRQTANTMVSLTIANLKLTNTSQRAPQNQKNAGFSIWKLQKDIHALIHGWRPAEWTGKLTRVSMQRIKRDDGVQEYTVVYSLGMTNV